MVLKRKKNFSDVGSWIFLGFKMIKSAKNHVFSMKIVKNIKTNFQVRKKSWSQIRKFFFLSQNQKKNSFFMISKQKKKKLFWIFFSLGDDIFEFSKSLMCHIWHIRTLRKEKNRTRYAGHKKLQNRKNPKF